jgi:HAMP domain-containing protein
MLNNTPIAPVKFISIRTKLLIIFTLIFTGMFGSLFYVFYNFAVNLAAQHLRDNLEEMTEAVAEGVDTEELLELYQAGAFDEETSLPAPQYQNQLAWLEYIHELDPDVWPYIFVHESRADLKPADEFISDNDEVIFVVDLWSAKNLTDSELFWETYSTSPEIIRTMDSEVLVHHPQIPYYDDRGVWITAYALLQDSQGQIIPGFGVGIDYSAEHLHDIKIGIQRRMVVTFVIFYILLFLLIYIAAERFTRRTIRLARVANEIGEGNYGQDLSGFSNSPLAKDEITQLADVFKVMVEKVSRRENKLRQQVAKLSIKIDEQDCHEQVKEITENDFFQELAEKAQSLRDFLQR